MHEVTSAEALRESEELHRLTLLSMSDAVFITTDEGAFTFICPNVDVIFGYCEDEVRAMDRISQLLGRDLIELEHLASTGEIRNIEHEVEAKDGTRHVLLVHVKRVSIKRGTIMYVCRDITEHKQAEHVLRDLGGRLIDAHEWERRRLSGELHDGIGQLVAVLSAELAMLRGQLASAPLVDQVDRLLAHTEDVGTELHRLSHDLHPAWLERTGLAASIRRVCTELASAHRIAIDVESAEVPAQLTNDVELCLYRIVQEALHNVVKHSGATRVTVRLEVAPGEIVLNVVDDGKGFDPVAERPMNGVGLVSMRERARQVDGSVTLTSKPGSGTHLHVRVPLGGATTCEAGVRPHQVQ